LSKFSVKAGFSVVHRLVAARGAFEMDADFLIHRVPSFQPWREHSCGRCGAVFGEVRFGDVNVNLRMKTALEELF